VLELLSARPRFSFVGVTMAVRTSSRLFKTNCG
jgi:hypothetical protein